MKSLFAFFLLFSVAACSVPQPPKDGGGDDVFGDHSPTDHSPIDSGSRVCSYPGDASASHRPCVDGTCCFGADWVNSCTCNDDGQLRCTAAGAVYPGSLMPGTPQFDCDPAHIQGECFWQVCAVGSVHRVVDGRVGSCVNVLDCFPIPCDPTYVDACPPLMACNPTSRVCVAR